MGRSNNSFTGSFGKSTGKDAFSCEDVWSLYTNYLGGTLGTLTIVANTAIPPLPSNESRTATNISNYATQLKVFRCPSNPNQPGNSQFWYAYFTGSANNLPVTIAKLIAAAQQSQGYCGDPPALWADREMYTGTMELTNHLDRGTGLPSGANVVCVDGSVRWFPFTNDPVRSFHVNEMTRGQTSNISQAVPGNAIYFSGLSGSPGEEGDFDGGSSVVTGTRGWSTVNPLQ